MNERMEFRARVKKPRRELSLPPLTFHHADHWMKVLGMEVFSAWLMIYTWCDREQYPQDDISHHKNIRNIADAFGCKSVDKAQKIIKKLYEFGLIDIVQEKNKFGSMKNIYYWYDIPIYADSMFCELRKCRNWEDRNSHGQELVKLRKIKEKNSKLKSRTKKSYGFNNTQENSGFQDEPYEKIERQPYEKSVQYNYINNNVVDVVVEPPGEKNQKDLIRIALTEFQQQAEKVCGVRIPLELLTNLVTEYGIGKVKEKINMLGSVRTRNAPGFLIAALRDDFRLMPGRPPQQQQKKGLPPAAKLSGKTPKPELGNRTLRKHWNERS